MSKLLSAGFIRLRKNIPFWVMLSGMFLFGIYVWIVNYIDYVKWGESSTLSELFFLNLNGIGVVIAVFACMFIGTEYSNGTIRNKLTTGHTRGKVFLSNLIITSAAGILMDIAYIISYAALTLPVFGFEPEKLSSMAVTFGLSLSTIIFYSAVFTALCMLNQNKAAVSVMAVVLAFVMLLGAAIIHTMLSAPEFYSENSISYIDDTGNISTNDGIVENRNYIRGTKRLIYETVLDILPSGQAMQISLYESEHYTQILKYSAVLSIAVTCAGIILFRKKDIK